MQASQSCTTFESLGDPQVKRLLPFAKNRNKSSYRDGPTSPSLAEGPGLIHDAKNLLGALGLYADLLAAPGVLSDGNRLYAEEIRIIAERSNKLIEKLINHSTSVSVSREVVVISEIVENYKHLLGRLVGRTVKVYIDSLAREPINVPREAIERILLNLVKNAAAATPPSGNIVITIDRTDCVYQGRRHIVMTVADDGIGMSESTVKMLRDDMSPTKIQGRGLGFRIVRELVTNSGGLLDISSRPNRGTKISMSWPEVMDGKAACVARSSTKHPLNMRLAKAGKY
jgi:signal transduction histidine kinase